MVPRDSRTPLAMVEIGRPNKRLRFNTRTVNYHRVLKCSFVSYTDVLLHHATGTPQGPRDTSGGQNAHILTPSIVLHSSALTKKTRKYVRNPSRSGHRHAVILTSVVFVWLLADESRTSEALIPASVEMRATTTVVVALLYLGPLPFSLRKGLNSQRHRETCKEA